MRIAIAQMNPTVGDLDGNLAKALEMAEDAVAQGAGLIIYPAHALTGAPLEGLVSSSSFLVDARAHLESFAEACPILAFISCVAPTPDAPIPALPELLVVSPEQIDSLGIPALDEGDSCPLLEIEGENVALLLEDHFAPDLEFADVDLLVEMSADIFGEETAAPAAHGTLERMSSLARTCHCFVAEVNLWGSADGMVFAGGSAIVAPNGGLVHACPTGADDLFVFDTDLGADSPTIDPETVLYAPEALEWEALVTSTRDYIHKNGFTDVIIGLSGGIDSAVTATIAVDAFGAEHVHGVLMPGPYSSEGSVTDAETLAENLGIETMILPIDKPLASFHAVLAEACGGEVAGVAAENLQARIRTVHLMTVSNAHGWMLLNTGNKSEAAMGFSTLYGDTAGAYAPIGNQYKTDVYRLARWRRDQGLSIPENSLVKPPSAELYPGATDLDRLPEYDLLDALLRDHIEGGMGATDLVIAGHDARMVHDVLHTIQVNEYKRRNEPIAPILQGSDLTDDRGWPITCAWVDKP